MEYLYLYLYLGFEKEMYLYLYLYLSQSTWGTCKYFASTLLCKYSQHHAYLLIVLRLVKIVMKHNYILIYSLKLVFNRLLQFSVILLYSSPVSSNAIDWISDCIKIVHLFVIGYDKSFYIFLKNIHDNWYMYVQCK